MPGIRRERLVEVGAQFVGRARLARVVAGDGQAAADRLAGVLEPADVVALPAVQRDRNPGKPLERPVDVDAQGGVSLLRQREGLFHVLDRHAHDAVLEGKAEHDVRHVADSRTPRGAIQSLISSSSLVRVWPRPEI